MVWHLMSGLVTCPARPGCRKVENIKCVWEREREIMHKKGQKDLRTMLHVSRTKEQQKVIETEWRPVIRTPQHGCCYSNKKKCLTYHNNYHGKNISGKFWGQIILFWSQTILLCMVYLLLPNLNWKVAMEITCDDYFATFLMSNSKYTYIFL